eukprot:13997037-Alexandrium_andersonii.AAC.1
MRPVVRHEPGMMRSAVAGLQKQRPPHTAPRPPPCEGLRRSTPKRESDEERRPEHEGADHAAAA